MKRCPKCDEYKEMSCFCKCSRNKDGLQLWCKQCHNHSKKEQYRKYRKEDVILLGRKSLLKHHYGLTLQEYDDILKKQNGVCLICGKPETQKSNPNGKIDSLRVDHNHKTGKIRGLLCSKCNFGISQFNDDIGLLTKAIEYISLRG